MTYFQPWSVVPVDTTDMRMPVRCLRCGGIYDAANVHVIARYADCSVWNAPCCGAQVDDRPPRWGGGIEELRKGGAR